MAVILVVQSSASAPKARLRKLIWRYLRHPNAAAPASSRPVHPDAPILHPCRPHGPTSSVDTTARRPMSTLSHRTVHVPPVHDDPTLRPARPADPARLPTGACIGLRVLPPPTQPSLAPRFTHAPWAPAATPPLQPVQNKAAPQCAAALTWYSRRRRHCCCSSCFRRHRLLPLMLVKRGHQR